MTRRERIKAELLYMEMAELTWSMRRIQAWALALKRAMRQYFDTRPSKY